MNEPTLFDKIVAREIPAYIVWEDDAYMAFLTPFPSTPGLTLVIPKQNPGDYVFDMDDSAIDGLMKATKKVAKLLEKALNVKRVALVFEGTGVAHVHAKLYPLHGELAGQTNVWSKHVEFFPEYIGYLSTVEGPKMNEDELVDIQAKIQEAAKA
ncbi:MAG TPA: HIT family protein [Candidatus Saccharimonadales bacterium]|jgi:diadenosine tetraphosphate (Ap4A) HIT family hydrolase|nr:HIT family protein [Candidatus Saccharimonadales bacterium]